MPVKKKKKNANENGNNNFHIMIKMLLNLTTGKSTAHNKSGIYWRVCFKVEHLLDSRFGYAGG